MSEEQQHSGEKLSERVHEFAKEQFGTVEQEAPNKPSFLFVVLLASVIVIVIFVAALIVLHSGGAAWTRHSFRKHPTSRLVMPAGPASPVRWA